MLRNAPNHHPLALPPYRPSRPSWATPSFGLGVLASLLCVGAAVLASVLMVRVVSGAIFEGGRDQRTAESAAVTTLGLQPLQTQRNDVERARTASTAFASSLADFRARSVRPTGDVGLNLGAAEARRRDAELTALVLECIQAVNWYNLAAAAVPAAEMQAAGLPERFVWDTDCTP